jgi:hypothetical protein
MRTDVMKAVNRWVNRHYPGVPVDSGSELAFAPGVGFAPLRTLSSLGGPHGTGE